MSETASFVDPVFLARFGLSRMNAIDYFLHPLNPFRTKLNTSNEVLAMQGTGIGTLMQFGTQTHGGMPLSPQAAEEEYALALTRLNGEQYELLPPAPLTTTTPSSTQQQKQQQQQQLSDSGYLVPSPLFTIRHVVRTSPTTTKVLGIYYILEGVIYKSPSVRSLMKANVSRVLEGLSDACGALSKCARYQPATGYVWVFEGGGDDDDDDDDNEKGRNGDDENGKEDNEDPVALLQLAKSRKRRKVLDNRRPGERTDAEEEGIRASEAIDRILVRLAKSELIVRRKDTKGKTDDAARKPQKIASAH